MVAFWVTWSNKNAPSQAVLAGAVTVGFFEHVSDWSPVPAEPPIRICVSHMPEEPCEDSATFHCTRIAPG